jgi:hypothetical protein
VAVVEHVGLVVRLDELSPFTKPAYLAVTVGGVLPYVNEPSEAVTPRAAGFRFTEPSTYSNE